MTHPLLQQLDDTLKTAQKKLSQVQSESEIESVRAEIFGRNGSFQFLSKQMGTVPVELKPNVGQAFNQTKTALQQAIEGAKTRLESTQSQNSKSVIDVTLPGRSSPIGHKHPITQAMDECVEIFRQMGFIVATGPEIETVHHNFDALNTPSDHPSRSTDDTFYFNDGRLLRSQTSTVQIRVMESVKPPIRIIAPGRTFRRDTPDATHSMNFHQIEGLYVDQNVSMADLKATLLHFAREIFGSSCTGIRMRPHFFPFTEPSVEVDFSCIMCEGKGCPICKNSGWIEIAGAGMVDPNVFKAVGYDPEKWSGFAFGFGLERIAMLRHRINDLRFLYDNDVRFLSQF